MKLERDDSEEQRLSRANRVRKELGLPELAFQPQSLAPEVDHETLRQYASGTLSSDVALEIHKRTETFHSWNKALSEVLKELAKEQAHEKPHRQ